MKRLIFFVLLLLISLNTYFLKQVYAANPACPLPGDTKIYTDPTSGLCFSESDPLYNPGFNTTGGSISACGTNGQVQCPGGTTAGLPTGNVCVVQIGGQCFAGQGASGFNTPGCVQTGTTPLAKCPSPMDLSIRVVDNNGNGITTPIALTIRYGDAIGNPAPGKTVNISTDPLGNAVVKGSLYSGDHFIIVPSSPYYTFNPTQIGSNANFGDQEMDTTFSCGTALENGTGQPPCQFTATRNATPLPTPTTNNSLPAQNQQPNDATVNDTTTSLLQTMYVLAGIGLIAYVVMTIGGSGKL